MAQDPREERDPEWGERHRGARVAVLRGRGRVHRESSDDGDRLVLPRRGDVVVGARHDVVHPIHIPSESVSYRVTRMPDARLQVPPNCDLTLGLECLDKATPGRSVWQMRADERFENPAGIVGVIGGNTGNLNEVGAIRIGLGDGGAHDAVLLQVALNCGNIGVGFSADGFFDLDLKDEVHAALEVEAEVDAIEQRPLQGRSRDTLGNAEDPDDADGQDNEDDDESGLDVGFHGVSTLLPPGLRRQWRS